jgi:hypothetical protein
VPNTTGKQQTNIPEQQHQQQQPNNGKPQNTPITGQPQRPATGLQQQQPQQQQQNQNQMTGNFPSPYNQKLDLTP